MDRTEQSNAGSVNSGTYSPETVESLRFEEEIQSLMLIPSSYESSPPAAAVTGGSSFTALLGLPPPQAVELLHDSPVLSVPPLACLPTFPSNTALIDRAARFSVFAENSAEIGIGIEMSPSPAKPKAEPTESDDRKIGRTAGAGSKRKESEKSKGKVSAKKSKSAEESPGGGGDEKLPYVHVRARRGQATDSHSLAERARREKINARMKLLQELVPGCNKISGTALVLDEIINHVQSLQRQVEFLSMRLAAVNPRIDFSGLDNILSTECGRLTMSDGRGMVAMEQSAAWLDGMINGGKHEQYQQQLQRQSHIFVSSPGPASIFCYDSSNPNSVSLANQLKTELVALPNQLKTEL